MAAERRSADEAVVGNESFIELMKSFAKGSEDAAEQIAARYTSHLFRAVRSSLPKEIRSKVDSVDLVNTLWGAMLTKPSGFNGIKEPAQLIALLVKAARNRVIDEHRKYTVCKSRSVQSEEGVYEEVPDARRKLSGVAGDGRYGGREDTPSQTAVAREKWARVLNELTSQERQVVALRRQGLTYDEIAQNISGMSATGARRVVTQVVEMLTR